MNNYLYNALSDAALLQGLTPSAWAKQNGFSSGMLTAIKNGARPAQDSLSKFTTNWDDLESGLKVLEAYLKDEIERCGYSLDQITPIITANSKPVQKSTLDGDLKIIQRFMNHRPIRESIHGLAVLLQHSEWENHETSEVEKTIAQAEQDATMQKLTATKKRTKQQGERSA